MNEQASGSMIERLSQSDDDLMATVAELWMQVQTQGRRIENLEAHFPLPEIDHEPGDVTV
jgi:hypothetical protein